MHTDPNGLPYQASTYYQPPAPPPPSWDRPPAPPPPDEIVTGLPQIAKAWGVSLQQALRWLDAGVPGADSYDDSGWYISMSDLKAWKKTNPPVRFHGISDSVELQIAKVTARNLGECSDDELKSHALDSISELELSHLVSGPLLDGVATLVRAICFYEWSEARRLKKKNLHLCR